jgi:hypothetical protein
MAADRAILFARLEELGIAATTVEHVPMFTVEQSSALRISLPGAHTKNLFLTDKDGRGRVVVDESLLAFAEINCHPLENTATTRLATGDLLRFIRACGQEPLVVALS